MKKKFSLLLVSFLLVSCDYLNTYSIVNNSGEDLIVEASYYDSYIDHNNVKKSLMFNLASKEILLLDTINYKVKIKLKHNEEFSLGFKTNGYPNLEHNKKILIYKKDSLVFYGNQYIIQNLYSNTRQNHKEVLNIY